MCQQIGYDVFGTKQLQTIDCVIHVQSAPYTTATSLLIIAQMIVQQAESPFDLSH